MRGFKRRTRHLRYLGAGCVLAGIVSFMWTRTPYNDFRPLGYFLDFIFSMTVLLLSALYWESVCRLTPRSHKLDVALFDSAIRIVVFFLAIGSYRILLRIYSFTFYRLNLDIVWWPTVYEAMAIGIAAAFLLLVLFDYVRAKVINRKKRQVVPSSLA
ncbi:hypothetical protein Enr17x_37790 [Gimesia fumaroli]|uniref:Uncharacterized protein n=1 Tax=Gimesia fumaroli TaxID=2527976 RepID=A0A518IF47_9PLAN|nr:hypothetical protein Enr17x_37790 [Gimesia fumaroli]